MTTLKGNTSLASHKDKNSNLGIENMCATTKTTGAAPMMKMNLRSSKYANNMNVDCAGSNHGSCNIGVNLNGMGMPSEGISQRRGLRDITNQTNQANNTVGHTRTNQSHNQYQHQNSKYKNPVLNTMVYNENAEGDRTTKAVHKSKDNQQNTMPQTSKNHPEGDDMDESPSAMIMSTSPAEALVSNSNHQRCTVNSSGGSSGMKVSDGENDRKNIDFEAEMDLCVDKLNISDDIELDTSDDVVGNMAEHLNEKLSRHETSTEQQDTQNNSSTNDSLTKIQLQKQQIREQQELLRSQQMELEKQEELLRQKEVEAQQKCELEQQLIEEKEAESVQSTRSQQTDSTLNTEVNVSSTWGVASNTIESNHVTLANADIDDIDYRSRNNIFEATEYVQEQYQLYKEKEHSARVSPRYMEKQTQINHDMRSILIDWLVDIHFKFRCVPETLFLTVNILDRFLERKHVPKTRLQCVGITAFLIAAKYEEIYPPELQELQYMVDNAYSKQQIVDMESKILVALRYKITIVTPRVFLVRFLKAAHADNIVVHLASYILERSLQEESFITYAPSILAAAAVSIARRVANRRPWTPTLQYYSGYQYEELTYCINDMTSWVRSRHNSLEAVRRKYTSNKFYAVAKMDI